MFFFRLKQVVFYFPWLCCRVSSRSIFKVKTKIFHCVILSKRARRTWRNTQIYGQVLVMWFFSLPNIFIEFFHCLWIAKERYGHSQDWEMLVKKIFKWNLWPNKMPYIIQPSSNGDPYVLCRELAIARFYRNCSAKQYSHSNIYLIKVSPGMLNVQKMRFIMSEV